MGEVYVDQQQLNELMKNMTPGERARALRKKWNNYDADKPDPNAPKGDGDGSTQNVQEQEEQPPEEPKKEIWIPPPIKKSPTPPKTLWEQLTVRTVKSTSARSEPEIAALRSARRLRKSMTERSSKNAGRWDDTPYRARPPALRGLRAHHDWLPVDPPYLPPWAYDESVYNVRFQMWSAYDGHFGTIDDRAEYKPERVYELQQRKQRDMSRWYDKFCQLSA